MKYRYVATLYYFVRGLCKLFGYAYPALLSYPFTPAELIALAALKAACEDMNSKLPWPTAA